jgi:RimJ/RimL family protein N-acetyltransferase
VILPGPGSLQVVACALTMDFDYQPILTGELVALRPLAAGDYDALHAVASDPEIWDQHPAKRYKEPVFREFFKDALGCGGTLVAMEAGSGWVIGSSRFHGFDADRREVEIGWTFLARAYWGGTYNGEMKRLMCEHAFKFAESVVLLIAPENVRSQRAAEKIGAVREGTRPNTAGRLSCVYRIMAPSK